MKIFRWNYKGGVHAPEMTEEQLAALTGGKDALVVRFHSERDMRDLRNPLPDPDMGFARIKPAAEKPAYPTNNWGTVYGKTVVIPCKYTGRKDAQGRRVFADESGDFVVSCINGTPEYPARVRIASPEV